MNTRGFGSAIPIQENSPILLAEIQLHVDRSIWCKETFRPQLEVMDERFHAGTEF